MSEIKSNKISPRKGTTTTIGDSGDSVTISSGTTTTNAGTISTAGISGGTINNTTGTIEGLQQQINWQTESIKTSGFTALANEGYFCNTTSAAFTVTLPASPTVGDVVGIKDYANTFDTNNLTINPNGNKINSSTDNSILNVQGAAGELIYIDSTQGWKFLDASKAADITEGPTYIVATGGTITESGNFKIHSFTGPGTFTVCSVGNPLGGPNSVDYLIVAGGGGSGSGGGGAGGYRESSGAASGCYSRSPLGACVSALPVSAQGYPITVGGGGTGGCDSNPGSNSVFSTITSTGGGGQNNCAPDREGKPGGSGGGGGGNRSNSGGSGNTPPVSPPQGQNGGPGQAPGPSFVGAGGGGGATQTGFPGMPGGPSNGGNGATSSITGSSVTRAGGGGGDGDNRSPAWPGSTGGNGGGGDGGTPDSGGNTSGTNGSANTGGGAGGKGVGSGNTGGSGIVIIRYKFQ